MFNKENIERAEKMFALYREGIILKEIGKIYKVSGERVRQIIKGIEYINFRKERSLIRTKKECVQCGDIFYKKGLAKLCSPQCHNSFIYERKKRKQDIIFSHKTRKCSKCGKVKVLQDFYITKTNGFRRVYAHCKKCHFGLVKAWMGLNRDRNREINRRAMRKYYIKNREKLLKYYRNKRRKKVY